MKCGSGENGMGIYRIGEEKRKFAGWQTVRQWRKQNERKEKKRNTKKRRRLETGTYEEEAHKKDEGGSKIIQKIISKDAEWKRNKWKAGIGQKFKKIRDVWGYIKSYSVW